MTQVTESPRVEITERVLLVSSQEVKEAVKAYLAESRTDFDAEVPATYVMVGMPGDDWCIEVKQSLDELEAAAEARAEASQKVDDAMERIGDVVSDAVKSATEEESPSPQAVSPEAVEFTYERLGTRGDLIYWLRSDGELSCGYERDPADCRIISAQFRSVEALRAANDFKPVAPPTPTPPPCTYAALGYLLPEPRLHYRLRSDGVVQYEALPDLWVDSVRTEQSLRECSDFVPIGALGPEPFTYEPIGHYTATAEYRLRSDGVLECRQVGVDAEWRESKNSVAELRGRKEFVPVDIPVAPQAAAAEEELAYEVLGKIRDLEYRVRSDGLVEFCGRSGWNWSGDYSTAAQVRAASGFVPVKPPVTSDPVIIIPPLPPNAKLLGTYHSRPYVVTQYGELVTTTAQGDWRKSMTFGTVGELLEHREFVAAEVEKDEGLKAGEIVGTVHDRAYRIGMDGKSLEYHYGGKDWVLSTATLDELRSDCSFIPAESAPRN